MQFKIFSQPTKLLYSHTAVTVPRILEITTIGRLRTFVILDSPMLMCDKVTHKNLIDNRPLFRYYSSIWIEKTALIQYNKVSGRYLYEGKNTNH